MAFTFKQKFHAWWEGYDLHAGADAAAKGTLEGGSLEGAGEDAPAINPNIIEADRLEFLQLLWGAGHIRPGTKEHYLKDSKVLLLTDSTSVAEFGSGLGAYGRAMGGANICYVDCYETDPLLTETSDTRPANAEERKFTSYKHFAGSELPTERTYHRIVFNRFLHRQEDPAAMLRQAKDLLKDDGSILLNEYTAGPSGILPDETQAIMDGFGAPSALISRDIYCTALEELGFEVRTAEDRSQEHMGQIASAWLQLDQALQDAGADFDLQANAAYISQETDRWGAMSKALKDGQLEFSRIFALRK